MDSKAGACTECTRSCLSLHRAKCDPYPIVCSFFKVMFGKQFSEQLIVPPKFARILKSLEGKNTTLEDSTGQKWDVRLSKVKGSLVFQHGWHDFSLDHGIELGDFVVFHYFKGSHFIVQVFTRSGCERPALFSEKNYPNKRSKASKDCVAREGSDGTFNREFAVDSVHSQDNVRKSLVVVEGCPIKGSTRKRQDNVIKSSEDCPIEGSTSKEQDNVRKSLVVAEDCPIEGSTPKKPKMAPPEDFLVESYFMTSRSTSLCREDDRDFLFDLSAFEMPAKKVHTDETSIVEVNRCLQGFNQLEDTQIGPASINVEEWQIAETSPVTEMSPLLVSNEARSSREEPTLPPKSGADIPSDNNILQRAAATPNASELPAATENSRPPGATARTVKTEQLCCQHENDYWVAHHSRRVPRGSSNWSYLKEPTFNNGETSLNKMVKPEPIDFCDSTSALGFKITCSVQQDGESFLELRDRLPIKLCRQGSKMDQKLIVLRDPAGKRWPVIYQEKKGIKILANGWKEFRKYNNIQRGDQCTFVIENVEECIFKVEILHC